VMRSISGCERNNYSTECYMYTDVKHPVIRGRYDWKRDNRCWIKANYCSNNNDCDDNFQCTVDICDVETKECLNTLSSDKCKSVGYQTVLAIRVIGLDVQSTLSLKEMKSVIFGVTEDDFSADYQLRKCSYEKLILKPLSGVTESGENINDGVAEVKLEMNIVGQATAVIENTVLKAMREKYGILLNEVDFLMIYIPSGTLMAGTTDWKAYAILGHNLSVYNDPYTNYPGSYFVMYFIFFLCIL